MMANSQPKTWLITGCSRGIGRVLALMLLEKGAQVVATARDPLAIQELVDRYPAQCLALELDVRKIAQNQEVVAKALQHFGKIDVLVNNAGYGLQGTVEELTLAQFREQMETNFFGLLTLTQAVLPHMRARRCGWIVNVSSMAGMRGMPTFGAYNASKFAVEGLTEALAGEMKPFGVRVSAIEPGPYRTDWAGSSLDRSEPMANLSSDSPYYQLNHDLKTSLDARSGNQPGDPKQIASVLIEAAEATEVPVHMVFGDIAIQAVHDRLPLFESHAFVRYFPHDQYHF